MNLSVLKLKVNLLFIELYYGVKDCKYKIKSYFLNKKIERLATNFTECRAIHSVGKKKGKLYYKFYIVDYNMHDDGHSNILDMRNKGLTKTKYFHTKKEVMEFLNKH